MRSRSQRREEARLEARIKLAIFGVVGFALLAGGIRGFATALIALVVLLVLLAVASGAAYLVLRSKLVAQKKVGLLAIIVAILTGLFWMANRAPSQWPEDRATVVSISGPSAVTDTPYSYRPDRTKPDATLTISQTKQWKQLSDAQKYRPGSTAIYFNPANPVEASFQVTKGWTSISATPGTASVRVTGEASATLRIGSILQSQMGTVTGPQVADYNVGATIPVWTNPSNPREFSLRSQTTEGEQKDWMAVLAGMLAAGGLGALFVGKTWRAQPISRIYTASFPTAQQEASDRHAPAPKTAEHFAVSPVTPTGTWPLATIPTELSDGALYLLEWRRFEELVAAYFEAQGFTAKRVSVGADGGVDLYLYAGGSHKPSAYVQCKSFFAQKVDVKLVREFFGVMARNKISAGYFVTSGNYTTEARAFAEGGYRLIDGPQLIKAFNELPPATRTQILTHAFRDDYSTSTCPSCDIKMVLRGGESEFWGCSNFSKSPSCRATLSVRRR